MPCIYVVLGMHKSGTTLVSEVLHHSGIRMVERTDPKGYYEGNHYERESTNRFNKALLQCGEKSSIRVIDRLDAQDVPADASGRATALVECLSVEGGDWGFKDPRTCLTYDFWKHVLPAHRLVCVFRDVTQVHARYLKRTSIDPVRGVRTLRAWHAYNRFMMEAYDGAPANARILVDYSRLMQDDAEIDRLARFVGRGLTDRRVQGLSRRASRQSMRLRLDAQLFRYITGNDVFELNVTVADIIAAEILSATAAGAR